MTTEEIMKIEDENERRKLMMAKMKEEGGMHHAHGGCPGSRAMPVLPMCASDLQRHKTLLC